MVQLHSKLSESTDFVRVAERDYLNRMLVGDIPITGEMMMAIEGGDPAPAVDISSINLIVR